jgi:hypothetical protein
MEAHAHPCLAEHDDVAGSQPQPAPAAPARRGPRGSRSSPATRRRRPAGTRRSEKCSAPGDGRPAARRPQHRQERRRAVDHGHRS